MRMSFNTEIADIDWYINVRNYSKGFIYIIIFILHNNNMTSEALISILQITVFFGL